MILNNDYIYFSKCGYKCYPPEYMEYVIKGFQSHCNIEVDGVIGPETRKRMRAISPRIYCPEVYEKIYDPDIFSKFERDYQSIEELLKYNLKGLSGAFVEAAFVNDVSVFHIIAHAILEGDWGRSKIAVDKKNLFGWAAYDSSAYDSALGFKSFEQCIKEWTKWFKNTYLLPTGKYFCGNNEYGVHINYATSPVAGINKSFLVRELRASVK